MERLAEVLTLAKDRDPTQSRLESLEAELLEDPAIVRDRTTPLTIVVVLVQRIAYAPPAARAPIGSDRDADRSGIHQLGRVTAPRLSRVLDTFVRSGKESTSSCRNTDL